MFVLIGILTAILLLIAIIVVAKLHPCTEGFVKTHQEHQAQRVRFNL